MPGRTIAIGDIHGCSAALERLLRVVQPEPADKIIALGDYIDRGPDSRGVIDQLIDLSRRVRLVPHHGQPRQDAAEHPGGQGLHDGQLDDPGRPGDAQVVPIARRRS